MDGFLLIDKAGAMTSHDVVAKVRKKLDTKKVGHAGTLDPMATGVLVLGVGIATRLLPYITDGKKAYLATISWLVIPPALSTNRKPSINSPFSRAFYMDLQQLVLRPHVISLTPHQPYAFVQLNHSLQKQIHPYHLKRIQVMV